MKRFKKSTFLLGLCLLILSGSLFICYADGADSGIKSNDSAPAKLTVEEAVKLAIEHNLQFKMAQGDLNVAADKMAQAKSGYYPSVTVGAGVSQLSDVPDLVKLGRELSDLNNALGTMLQAMYAGGVFSSPPTTNPYLQALQQAAMHYQFTTGPDDGHTYYGFSFTLQQPLYTGGKLTALNKQAQVNLEFTKVNLEIVRENLIFQVKNAYYTILQAERMEQTLREAVASMENHVNEANVCYKAGVVAKIDVVRAEAKLADFRQKLIMAQNGVALAKKYFNFVLGIDLNTEYNLVESVQCQPFQYDIAQCKELALASRPELHALRLKEEMARQAIEIVKSGQKPLVAFVVQGDNKDTKGFFNNLDWSFSLMANYKLYDGGLVKNQIAEAEDNVKQVKTGEELQGQVIGLEVEQAYRNLENALQAIQVAEKSLDQAKETERMAQVSYKAGLATSLERIDAEVGLTQAKNNYTQALASYNIALAQLEKAIGAKEEHQ